MDAFLSRFSAYISTEAPLLHIAKEDVAKIILTIIIFLLIHYTLFRVKHQRMSKFDLKQALERHEFIPYAQPLVDAKTRKLVGIEILMRWNHPTLGVISPDLFIPQAEESGLIVPMTSHILQTTAKTLAKMKNKIPKGLHVGINITTKQCHGMRLLFDCQEFLAEVNGSNVQLMLELTERQIFENTSHIHELFSRLDGIGVKFAIDDFGTGYSNLNVVNIFNISCLKIDLSFIRQIGTTSNYEHLIDNIIDLGERLSIDIIAEGIENDLQADILQRKGINQLQGYLFGRPMPLDTMLSSQNGVT